TAPPRDDGAGAGEIAGSGRHSIRIGGGCAGKCAVAAGFGLEIQRLRRDRVRGVIDADGILGLDVQGAVNLKCSRVTEGVGASGNRWGLAIMLDRQVAAKMRRAVATEAGN